MFKVILLLTGLLTTYACSQLPETAQNASEQGVSYDNVELVLASGKHVRISDAAPSGRGGIYKIGQPYEIDGLKYYPKENYRYVAEGLASWYGPNFNQKATSNGEIFDQNLVSGAHKTLPLPSIVRVTNLDNGRSLIVRVNDRGPYVTNRIIDLSRRGAELLGYKEEGTAHVRVEIMPEESMRLKQEILAGKNRNAVVKLATTPVKSHTAKNNDPILLNEPIYQKKKKYSATHKRGKKGMVVRNMHKAAAKSAKIRKLKDAHRNPYQVQSLHGSLPYFIQIGSYTSRAVAESKVRKLQKLGFHAYIKSAEVKGDTYHRVRIQGFSNKQTMRQALDKLIDKGFRRATIFPSSYK